MEQESAKVSHLCFFCGEPTEDGVVDVVSKKSVPVCWKCYRARKLYPTKKNVKFVSHWQLLFPILEAV